MPSTVVRSVPGAGLGCATTTSPAIYQGEKGGPVVSALLVRRSAFACRRRKVDALASRHQGRALPLPHSAAPSWNSAAAAPSWPSAQERRVVPATPRNPNCLLLESTHWELESGERGWMAANRKLQCAVWKSSGSWPLSLLKLKIKEPGPHQLALR